MLALEIIAQRIRVMRDGRTVDPQQVGGMSFDHDDAPVGRHRSVVFVEHRTRGRLVAGQIGS